MVIAKNLVTEAILCSELGSMASNALVDKALGVLEGSFGLGSWFLSRDLNLK
ncbi:unnamed protein product [Sphenostylis stenocarpa]|uniref:Uncharacterized protein n=1 Tax=Sphenostylis stenocarpa TaxID=92480 RepID=A0AA86SSA3_9FABA|nr:unnamed protein product [Sphenostylis stenocarpa]